MKKLISSMLAGLMLFSLAACGGKEEDKSQTNNSSEITQPAPEPVYTSDEKFDIGMWVGIDDTIVEYDDWGQKVSSRQLTEAEFMERYVEVAEAGITIAYPGYTKMLWSTEAYNKLALKAAYEAGIKQIISISALR